MTCFAPILSIFTKKGATQTIWDASPTTGGDGEMIGGDKEMAGGGTEMIGGDPEAKRAAPE